MGPRLTAGATERVHAARRAAFARVLCGIDATRTDPETVSQAAALAAPDGELEIVCDAYHAGVGANSQATIVRSRAERALKLARALAQELGVDATTRVVTHPEPWRAILAETPGHDLLVIGSHPHSRAGGAAIGEMASELVHRAECPVLVARRVPGTAPFPQRMIVAVVGTESSPRAIQLARRIHRAHDSQLVILTVDEDPKSAIVEAAREHSASLVVLGSGGKSGLRAIGSVSEHVAHHAPCSVLVARREQS